MFNSVQSQVMVNTYVQRLSHSSQRAAKRERARGREVSESTRKREITLTLSDAKCINLPVNLITANMQLRVKV